MSLEEKITYTNRFTVSVSPRDTVLTFMWITPEYDDEGNITSDNMMDKTVISMSRESFTELHALINELYEKAMKDDGKE